MTSNDENSALVNTKFSSLVQMEAGRYYMDRVITIRCTRSRGPRGFFCLHDFRRGPVNVAVIRLEDMNAKITLIVVVAFVLGAASHFALTNYLALDDDAKIDVAKHWRLVDEYRNFIDNPTNYEQRADGLVSVSFGYDPEPSFVALAAAGEIESVDIVLPAVPKNRESELYWMDFVSKRKNGIVYATGNPEYADFKPNGSPPLHLKLWFRESAKSAIKQLIDELEQLPSANGG